MKKDIILLALLALGLAACEPEFDKAVDDSGFYSAGDVDFSNYVAVGNSLTAGFADNALYLQGQENSYPNIMAQQFAHAGGGDFIQPLVNDNLGGLLAGGNQITDNRMVLEFDAEGNPAPTILDGTPTTDITNTLEGPINNMGVPGAKIYHLVVEGYGDISGVGSTANPYFVRFASSADASVIADAVAQNPTFFTLWIGNNDILSYASSGGVGVDRTGDLNPANYGSNDITDPNVFASIYNTLLESLAGNGAKGAVANIPDVTSIPFFTTVPYAPVPMDAQTAAFVNSGYEDYNNAMLLYAAGGLISQEEAQKRQIKFQAGQNPVVIVDEDLTALPNPQGGELPKIRQTTQEDLIVLRASSFIGTTVDNDPTKINGVSVPLEDQWVLTPEEQLLVSNAQTQYNAVIKNLAEQYELAFVDARSMLAQTANGGIPYDGGTLTSTYASGGAFSLDGVHPTAKGYALVANAFINAINETYNSTIPIVNPGTYPDVFVK